MKMIDGEDWPLRAKIAEEARDRLHARLAGAATMVDSLMTQNKHLAGALRAAESQRDRLLKLLREALEELRTIAAELKGVETMLDHTGDGERFGHEDMTPIVPKVTLIRGDVQDEKDVSGEHGES